MHETLAINQMAQEWGPWSLLIRCHGMVFRLPSSASAALADWIRHKIATDAIRKFRVMEATEEFDRCRRRLAMLAMMAL